MLGCALCAPRYSLLLPSPSSPQIPPPSSHSQHSLNEIIHCNLTRTPSYFNLTLDNTAVFGAGIDVAIIRCYSNARHWKLMSSQYSYIIHTWSTALQREDIILQSTGLFMCSRRGLTVSAIFLCSLPDC